ncbi:MAG: hypothetical protein ACTHNZ_17565 [Trinickia sp.]|uniref:hypothetical protein n=1 Tax=Trinickia sp. TaxID=2571163 RepID=UPI003F8145F7
MRHDLRRRSGFGHNRPVGAETEFRRVGSSSGEDARPRLIDVDQTQHGDHVVEHSGAETLAAIL